MSMLCWSCATFGNPELRNGWILLEGRRSCKSRNHAGCLAHNALGQWRYRLGPAILEMIVGPAMPLPG
jgi:hypothetical protein